MAGVLIKSGCLFLLSWFLVSQAAAYFFNATGLERFAVWATTKDVAADPSANIVFIGSSHTRMG